MALGLADGTIELRSTQTLALRSRRAAHRCAVSALCCEAEAVVSGDEEGFLVRWAADERTPGEDWRKLWQQRHLGRVVAIQTGGNGSVLSAAMDGNVTARHKDSGDLMFNIPNHKIWLGSLSLSEDRDLLVTDGRDNAVWLYDFAA